MKKKEDFNYDVRIVSRHIRDGVISKKDYDKYLSKLPDVEENSEPLVIEDEVQMPSAAPDQPQEDEDK